MEEGQLVRYSEIKDCKTVFRNPAAALHVGYVKIDGAPSNVVNFAFLCDDGEWKRRSDLRSSIAESNLVLICGQLSEEAEGEEDLVRFMELAAKSSVPAAEARFRQFEPAALERIENLLRHGG